MRIIGVLDLLGGRAVHARAGRREHYAAVLEVAGSSIEPGDAVALARTYIDRFGIDELYAADLDAILDRLGPAYTRREARGGRREARENDAAGLLRGLRQDRLVTALTALGVPLWLDAAVSTIDRAEHALANGAARVIVGLETLPSYAALNDICVAVGSARVAFSLDLRHGEPIVSGSELPAGEPAHVVAARAADAGASAVIVLDLARVGTGVGLDGDLIGRVRAAVPSVTLLAGGGVRGLKDLIRLVESGCDGALVATAVQNGRLGRADLEAAQRFGKTE